MATYKFLKTIHPGGTENQTTTIIRTDVTPNSFIPFDPANLDYQEYLEWVEEGNTAEAADTLTSSQKWANVRAVRNSKLRETDWSQGSDVPNATKTKWQTYRQDLREIPQKQTDPTNITWPTKPS